MSPYHQKHLLLPFKVFSLPLTRSMEIKKFDNNSSIWINCDHQSLSVDDFSIFRNLSDNFHSKEEETMLAASRTSIHKKLSNLDTLQKWQQSRIEKCWTCDHWAGPDAVCDLCSNNFQPYQRLEASLLSNFSQSSTSGKFSWEVECEGTDVMLHWMSFIWLKISTNLTSIYSTADMGMVIVFIRTLTAIHF